MKVEIKTNPSNPSPKPFPKLMILKKSRDLIVLMESSRIGTVIKPDSRNDWKIGEYYGEWVMNLFEDFDDILELQND